MKCDLSQGLRFILGNEVKFTSEPTFTRTLDETIVHGCTYTSTRNIDFLSNAFITVNEDLFKLNSSSRAVIVGSTGNEFTLTNYTFSHFINSGTFKCLIQIGEENFFSNSSVLYEIPSKYFIETVKV